MNKKLKLWELNQKTEVEYRKQKKFPIVVVLDDIRSLNNIGSFLRTADAFNIEKILSLWHYSDPHPTGIFIKLHLDQQKQCNGASQNVLSCINDLHKDGYEICVIEQTEETTLLQEVSALPKRPTALIFGNEVNGVGQAVVDFSNRVIEIPQFGTTQP